MSILHKVPLLRKGIETFSRGRKLKRTLPNGKVIYLSPDSQLKYFGRKFDVDLVDIARIFVHAESVVWDIGANCGVLAFSSAAAKQIVAVEADPFLCSLIQESIIMNGTNVILVTAAAFSSSGLAEFAIASRGRASNHLASVQPRSQTGGVRSRLLVPTITLDGLLEKLMPPTFIKIDVEGAEVEVLEGAMRVVSEYRPILYLETNKSTHAKCEQICSSAGYRMTKGAEMNWLCQPV